MQKASSQAWVLTEEKSCCTYAPVCREWATLLPFLSHTIGLLGCLCVARLSPLQDLSTRYSVLNSLALLWCPTVCTITTPGSHSRHSVVLLCITGLDYFSQGLVAPRFCTKLCCIVKARPSVFTPFQIEIAVRWQSLSTQGFLCLDCWQASVCTPHK